MSGAAPRIVSNPLASKRMSKRKLYPKPLLDEEMVIAACDEAGIKRHNAYKMWRGLIQGKATSVDDIKGLPKALCHLVKTDFQLTTSEVIKTSDSDDGATTKLLVKLQDGKMIEAVIMRYGSVQFSSYVEQMEEQGVEVPDMSGPNAAFRSKPRATLCLSSQVGCAMACSFCATGTMNLQGNLTSGEILEQLWHANQVTDIRNIVFMGMGEPLDNYVPVLNAIKGMCDVQRWSLKHDRVSLSTVGVVPKLHQLAKDAPWVNLALSLHAPNNTLRQQIVPSTKAWHLDRIMAALDDFIACQNAVVNRIKNTLIEYVLIGGVNDSDDVANELGVLLSERPVVLNVIPYNITDVPHDYKPPSQARNDRFIEIVRTHGVKTIQRQKLGDDIAGACGQLVVRTINGPDDGKSQKGNKAAGDLEDLYAPSADSGGTKPGCSGGGGSEPRDVVGVGVHEPSRGARSRKLTTVKPESNPAGPAAAAAAASDLAAATVQSTVATAAAAMWLPITIAALGAAFVLFRLLARAGGSGDGGDEL